MLVKETLIPDKGDQWDTVADVPLAIDNTLPARIDRVAYCLRLGAEWVWTSFDWTDATKLGVPADYQINGPVAHLNIFSNAADIRPKLNTNGKAEFWHNCYRRRLEYYDANDKPAADQPDCYGSMQVHAADGQTLFGFNGWSRTDYCDVTIGSAEKEGLGYSDGTFNDACEKFHGDTKSAILTYVRKA
jgi:hypothetical protein